MHDLAQKVLGYIRRQTLIHAGDRVAIAVSAGADSVALLRLLLELRAELGIVLSVAHFNHNLRVPEADLDQRFVAELAQAHQLELHCADAKVRDYSAGHQLSLEAAARHLRYEWFQKLLSERVNRLATAHTQDDQAETVLLRMVRGAGTRGLAGIYPTIACHGHATVVRPLLKVSRSDLLRYLSDIHQDWREDGSNRDLRFARNRVRHGILPRLARSLNPSVREALAEAAEIARAEQAYWDAEMHRLLPAVWDGTAINLAQLSTQPLAVQRRIVRASCESLDLRLEFKHVEEILQLCPAGGPRSAELPGGWTAIREKGGLRIFRREPGATSPSDYEYDLHIPGEVAVAETGTCFQALLVTVAAPEGYNPEHLLDRRSVGSQLKIRNWRPGDRFWPAHSKSSKKVKDLLQDRHITGAEKKLWPVAVDGSEVIWVRGFPLPSGRQPAEGSRDALLIREVNKS